MFNVTLTFQPAHFTDRGFLNFFMTEQKIPSAGHDIFTVLEL